MIPAELITDSETKSKVHVCLCVFSFFSIYELPYNSLIFHIKYILIVIYKYKLF